MPHSILLLILFILSSITVHSQNKNIQYHGNIESGISYNTLISPYSPYPQTYSFIKSQQQINVFALPFDVSFQLTNLQSGLPSKGLYPNLINIHFDQNKFKQNIHQRTLNEWKQKYETYLAQYSSKQENDQYIRILDSIQSTLPDSLSFTHKKDSILKTLSPSDSIGMQAIQEEYRQQMSLYHHLQSIKNKLYSQNQTIHLNDSVLQTYQSLQQTSLDLKEYQKFTSFHPLEKWMTNLQLFNAGRFFWTTSNPLISSGLTIDGTELHLKFKPLLLGAIYGKTYPLIFWNQYNGFFNNNIQNVLSAWTGLETQNHLLKFTNTLFSGKNYENTVQENTLLSAEYSYQSSKINTRLFLSASQTNVNSNSTTFFYQGLPVIYNYSADNTIQNILSQRTLPGLQTGFAFSSQTSLNLSPLFKNISVHYELISPFYHSSAHPYLFKDQQFIELKNTLSPSKKLTLVYGAYFREDNLSKLKSVTTTWKNLLLQIKSKISSASQLFAEYKIIHRASNTIILQHQLNTHFSYSNSSHLFHSFSLFTNYFFSQSIPSLFNAGTSMQLTPLSHIEWLCTFQYTKLNPLNSDDINQLNTNNYTLQSSFQFSNKNFLCSLNGFLFLKGNSSWNRGGDLSFKILFNKHISLNFLGGYGQNRTIWNELNLLSLQNQSYLLNHYFYGNISCIIQW